ncbi:MAG TPA: hypothetical protein VIL74_21815 [Pyrinomonadaceae bacterium]|jgi:hypothetical protein
MKIKLLFAVFAFCCLVLTAPAQTKQPRTVREFFTLLPQKYFTLEGCRPEREKNCDAARREYIERFLEIEDAENGYWKSGCDGAQSCLTMALFKRPDASYVVALKVEFEMGTDNYFLEYKNGRWYDVSRTAVPNFSKDNIYELPREGTTVEVFAEEKTDDIPERGKKLYSLVWKNGKFSVKR